MLRGAVRLAGCHVRSGFVRQQEGGCPHETFCRLLRMKIVKPDFFC
jgi:hypothetical protein